MTKEITKAYILQEIQDKFKLRDFEPETFRFDEKVVPTYEIGKHLLSMETSISTASVSSAAAFPLYVVPQTERWFLHRYTAVFTGAGAIKTAGISLARAKSGHAHHLYLDLTKNQTMSYAVNLPYPVELESGDKLYVVCDDYTSTQNFILYIDYTKETIR